jgi:carbonic anhydrase/acetyltransferase-like protein (isoleucine patch superfamily)
MKGYLVELGGVLEPWGDPVGSLPVANRPLRQWSEDALRAAGCAAVERVPLDARLTGPALVLADELWLTPALARRFAQAVQGAAERRALALPPGPLLDFSLPLQRLTLAPEGAPPCWGYPLAWLPPGVEASACAWEGAALELIPVQHDAQELPIHPALVPSGRLVVPFGDESALRLEHWMHLLRANQLALLAWGAHLVRREPWRLLWAAARALSFNKHRVMARLGSQGRGCDIHPTAVVEASVLGDGVRVGAHAVVRFSHLGDKASVSDLACVESSVLGAGASVARTGVLQGCVLMEGACTGFPGIQLSVLGAGAFSGGAVLLADFKPGGNVQVRHRGAVVDAGSPLLGCAVGHRTRLFMGATFYPGRAIPNDLTILGSTEHAVARIGSDLPTDRLLVARGGGVTPLGSGEEG